MGSCPRGCCPSPAAHFRSVTFGSAVLVDGNRRDRQLARDLAAYRRLTESGFEPQRIDGCAELEARQAPRHEIEGGLPIAHD